MPCSSWTTRSPVLRSRKSERKLRRPRRRPRAWRWTSSGKTSPSARTASAASGSSKPRERTPHAGQDARALADREAVLAQHVGEAVRAARCCRGRRRSWSAAPRRSSAEAAHVAGVGGRRTAGDVQAAPPVASTSRTSTRGRRGEPRLERRRGGRGPPSGSGASPSAWRSWSSTARAQKPSASCRTASGSITATAPGGRCAHGGTVAPGTRATSSTSALGREAALERLEEGRELAPAREALAPGSAGRRREHGARREDVGERAA